jgi:hypothetical protein
MMVVSACSVWRSLSSPAGATAAAGGLTSPVPPGGRFGRGGGEGLRVRDPYRAAPPTNEQRTKSIGKSQLLRAHRKQPPRPRRRRQRPQRRKKPSSPPPGRRRCGPAPAPAPRACGSVSVGAPWPACGPPRSSACVRACVRAYVWMMGSEGWCGSECQRKGEAGCVVV